MTCSGARRGCRLVAIVAHESRRLIRGVGQRGDDRTACRREALGRFSPEVMANGYEAIYRRVVGIDEHATRAGLRGPTA